MKIWTESLSPRPYAIVMLIFSTLILLALFFDNLDVRPWDCHNPAIFELYI